jgi:hypothetical protein
LGPESQAIELLCYRIAESRVADYGNGPFTAYTHLQHSKQSAGWVAKGIQSVAMKFGAQPEATTSVALLP